MTTRIYDGARGSHLAETEDDWFETVRGQPAELDDPAWENELEWQLRDPSQPDLGRRHAVVGLAALVAVFLVFAGVLIGRETKGSSTKVMTVTAAPKAQATPSSAAAGDKPAATSTPSTPSASAPNSSATTVGAGTTGSTPSTGTSTQASSAVPTAATLQGGAKGAAVVALQQALTALGYAPGTADGTYGATTTQAVTAFQKAKGLTADGVAGATTLTAINAAVARG